MIDTRQKNLNWSVTIPDGSRMIEKAYDGVFVALLMDIRDELQTLNRLLSCPNFLGMPAALRKVARNTTPKRPKSTVKK